MKRFSIGAVVGFFVVFCGFYLLGLTGQAGENSFESLTKTTSDPAYAKSGVKAFSALREPTVQDSKIELSPGYLKPHSQARTPASDGDEMQVTLRKVKESKAKEIRRRSKEPEEAAELIEDPNLKATDAELSEVLPQKIAMAETSQQKPEEHRESKVVEEKTYSVQVASNPDKAASEVLLKELESKGFEGYVQSAQVNEKQYYRVRLGPVATKEAANEIKEKALHVKGVAGALVLKD